MKATGAWPTLSGMNNSGHTFSGVDGCPAGWFTITGDIEGNASAFLFSDAEEVWKSCRTSDLVLVDIPIGLPSAESRACDQQARVELSPLRHTSVFPAPARDALGATDYREACRRNDAILGVELSIMAYNI